MALLALLGAAPDQPAIARPPVHPQLAEPAALLEVGRYGETLSRTEAALTRLAATSLAAAEQRVLEAAALADMAVAAAELGRWAQADALAARAIQLAEATGQDAALLRVLAVRGHSHALDGNAAAFLDLQARAVERFGAAPDPESRAWLAYFDLGMALARRHDADVDGARLFTDRVLARLDQADPVSPGSIALRVRAVARILEADLLEERGALREAAAAHARALADLAGVPPCAGLPARLEAMASRLDLLEQLEDRAGLLTALAAAEAAEAEAPSCASDGSWPALDGRVAWSMLARVHALGATGGSRKAREVLEALLRRFDAHDSSAVREVLGAARLHQAALQARAGDARGAVAVLDEMVARQTLPDRDVLEEDADFAPIRSHPAFRAFLGRLGTSHADTPAPTTTALRRLDEAWEEEDWKAASEIARAIAADPNTRPYARTYAVLSEASALQELGERLRAQPLLEKVLLRLAAGLAHERWAATWEAGALGRLGVTLYHSGAHAAGLAYLLKAVQEPELTDQEFAYFSAIAAAGLRAVEDRAGEARLLADMRQRLGLPADADAARVLARAGSLSGDPISEDIEAGARVVALATEVRRLSAAGQHAEARTVADAMADAARFMTGCPGADAHFDLAWLLLRLDEADRVDDAASGLSAIDRALALVPECAGKMPELRLADRQLSMMAIRARILEQGGQVEAARAERARVVERFGARAEPDLRLSVGQVLLEQAASDARRGEVDAAVAGLRAMVARKTPPDMAFLEGSADFARVRDEPTFRAFLAEARRRINEGEAARR